MQATCSLDPNDKQVSPKGCGPEGFIPAGQPLTYYVEFQNVGTGPAYQVIVDDILTSALDVSTVKVLGSSHPGSFTVTGQKLEWIFPDIELPPASEDEPNSHGYVKFQVLPLASNPIGTVITNTAKIIFDLNNPILTATTTNTISASPLPVASFSVTPAVGFGWAYQQLHLHGREHWRDLLLGFWPGRYAFDFHRPKSDRRCVRHGGRQAGQLAGELGRLPDRTRSPNPACRRAYIDG